VAAALQVVGELGLAEDAGVTPRNRRGFGVVNFGNYLRMNTAAPILPILYSFRRCPYAMRARLALAASGLVVELREVDLKDKPAAMLQASPKGTVPVLVDHSGRVLEESLDIMLWALQQHDPAHWLVPETDSLEMMLALIAQCDGDFKQHLDRYKYPGRYADVDVLAQRTAGAEFLAQLDARLHQHPYLFGQQPALADMAIAPFVRQFAQTDLDWFNQQPWPALRVWLASIIDAPSFANIMTKYANWAPGAERVCFPSLD